VATTTVLNNSALVNISEMDEAINSLFKSGRQL